MTRPPLTSKSAEEQRQLAERIRADHNGVWAYVRVSTDAQEDGTSLESQEEQIRAYAKKAGLAEPSIVREVASAGKPMISVSLPGVRKSEAKTASPRPLLLLLIGHITERSNQHLIIWKLDRLARITYEQEMLVELMHRRDVTVHSVQASERELLKSEGASGDPSRALFRTMMAAVAQYERAVIALRTRTGAQMKASRGGWVGGCVPYGYRRNHDAHDIQVDAEEAEAVRWIFYLRGQQVMSFDNICRELERRGIGERWNKTKVHRIWHARPLYEGVYLDPFTHEPHNRPDLRILPETWATWAEANHLVSVPEPDAAEDDDLERMPAYGQDEEA